MSTKKDKKPTQKQVIEHYKKAQLCFEQEISDLKEQLRGYSEPNERSDALQQLIDKLNYDVCIFHNSNIVTCQYCQGVDIT